MGLDLKKLQGAVNVEMMTDDAVVPTPLAFANTTVPNEWLDYNGHMNESMYMIAASFGYEAFAQYVGLTSEWVATKGSYFTAENHCVYLDECSEGDELTIKTLLADADKKRLHMVHYVYRGDDLCFAMEQMNLYVDVQARRVAEVPDEMWTRIEKVKNAHAEIEAEYTSRTIGIKKK